MTQNIYREPGQRGNANLQRVIDAADADRKAAAEYRALQDRTMRENRETSRKMVRGEF